MSRTSSASVRRSDSGREQDEDGQQRAHLLRLETSDGHAIARDLHLLIEQEVAGAVVNIRAEVHVPWMRGVCLAAEHDGGAGLGDAPEVVDD